MSSDRTHAELTSAETKSIGFDYQYYFFLWKVLSLEYGETVGLEVKDDVHTELNDSTQILYQLKHTIKTKQNNSPINLSSLDKDLWKTLSNWIQVITDKADDRAIKKNQLEFINKTSFVLATNKSSSKSNDLINAISNFQNDSILIEDFNSALNKLLKKATDVKVIEYITRVIALDNVVLSEFIRKIHFELDENEIISKCKNAIKSDKVPVSKINDVYSSIDSAIREDNFLNIKQGKKIKISFDDFSKKYRKYYDIARSCPLAVRPFTGHLPDRMEDQIFVQQLLELNDITNTDIEDIAEFTEQRLNLAFNLNNWLINGELTGEEIQEYLNDAALIWKNEHRKQMRSNEDDNVKGLKVLDVMREKKLDLSDSSLSIALSNGSFYELSNVPKIGWRKDWEKYKK